MCLSEHNYNDRIQLPMPPFHSNSIYATLLLSFVLFATFILTGCNNEPEPI